MKTGATLLVDCLIQRGVKYIFGIPGAKIDAVFNALVDSNIKLILCRHEQNAAFMAAAYGRLTGTPGIVLVTSGPGVSNLATGLLTATTEGDPVIAIGGNVSRNMKLKETHQSTDNIKLMEAVTKARMEALSADTLPEIIENAFRIAERPRSGAVFISIPQDVLHEKTEAHPLTSTHVPFSGYAPHTIIEQAIALINKAQHPVLLLGTEASRPVNTAMIRALLQQHPFATISTYQAAGVISRELEKNFVGRVGLFKNQPGDKLLDHADLVITVGYNPVEYDPEIWNATQSKKIIHIDYNPADIHTAYTPTLEVMGNIALNIEKILRHLTPRPHSDIHQEISVYQDKLQEMIESGAKKSGAKIHPLRFIYDVRQMIGEDTIVISDIGSHYMWLARYFFSYEPHHLLFSNGQQTLGVALPWAIATHYAKPDKKIISISGDGGFLFSACELETAVRENIPLIHFVWVDGSYNMVLEQEIIKYKRDSGVHFGYVDIVKFADAFGATGFRVNQCDDLIPILKKALTIQGPVLIEIPIDYSDNPALFATLHENTGN